MKALLFGLGVGVGLAVWTSRPAMVEAMGSSFAVLLGIALAVAFFAGKARRPDFAQSTASATAVATSAPSQRVVVNVEAGARAHGQDDHAGLDEAEWIGDRLPDEVVELVDVEADELADLVDEREPSPPALTQGQASGGAVGRGSVPRPAAAAIVDAGWWVTTDTITAGDQHE